MIRDMAAIAAECVIHPGRLAVWSPQLQRYVCPADNEVPTSELDIKTDARPPISPLFKIVFGAAAGGTLLFVALCVFLAYLAGRERPTVMIELIRAFTSLAQIGFGAVVGLLGAKRIEGGQRAIGDG